MGRGSDNQQVLPQRQRDAADVLLPRDAWREAVFSRDKDLCVICGQAAVDAHHIVERKLWPDGGYYLANGVSVCSACHLKAEQTLIGCDELRAAAGIDHVLLPPQYTASDRIDKWGNLIGEDGTRYPGELFYSEQVQKVLREAGLIDLYAIRFKHPRTPHAPWSEGRDADDIEIADLSCFVGKEVVVSEKLDGESLSAYSDGYSHARSVDSKYHPSRERARALMAAVAHELPPGWRIGAENMQAVHSIAYDGMQAWAYVYAIWNERNECISYDDTLEWCALLGLQIVPELYRGIWDEEKVKACWTGVSKLGGEQEGYVVRTAEAFGYSEYRNHVMKMVRRQHVKTDQHWMHSEMVENKLAL